MGFMTELPSTFDRFAARIFPDNPSGKVRDRFRLLARVTVLEKDRALEFDHAHSQLVFVSKGATKLVAHVSKSRDQIVGFNFTGDIFSIPERGNYSYSVCALSDCEVMSLSSDELLDLAANEAKTLRHLLEHSYVSLTRYREKTIALGTKTAGERVAVFLLAMAERIGIDDDGLPCLDLPMSRRDIAESLGLTIETVSRQLSLLRDAGLIATVGRSGIELRNLAGLRTSAGYLHETT